MKPQSPSNCSFCLVMEQETSFHFTSVSSGHALLNPLQGDSGGICNTLGNDSMCDSKQKSSYEHGSDFEQLPRYGKKKIRTILRA